MSCHGDILNFISNLSSGEWFSTQQVLNLGTREAIDQALYRLVKCGYLTRIAWGLFTLRTNEQNFEPLAVAKFKAQVFKKKIAIHGLDIATVWPSPPSSCIFQRIWCQQRIQSNREG
jgi:hypothetical protein